MKGLFQQFASSVRRHLGLALVCLLLFSVFFAAWCITADISTIVDHQAEIYGPHP